MIPLEDDMVLSFVNYELKIKFESRTPQEVISLQNEAEKFFGSRKAGSLGYIGEVPCDSPFINIEEDIQIFVQTASGRTIPLDVKPSSTTG